MSGKNIEVIDKSRTAALGDISERFQIKETVHALQGLMREVTKDRITPDTVNAACNCVQNLNLTIKTAIQAARFLADNKMSRE